MNPNVETPSRDDGEDDGPLYDGPSKSQRKRDMHGLQELGEELAGLSVERLRSLDLPDRLLEALLAIKSIKAHGAVRRQQQFIGKLMRDVDPAPLRAQLDIWAGNSREAVVRSHLAEHWRERLLADDDAFTALLAEFPATDIPTMRTLIRNARKERGDNRPPRNFRELYRLLLAQIEGRALARADGDSTAGAETDAHAPAEEDVDVDVDIDANDHGYQHD